MNLEFQISNISEFKSICSGLQKLDKTSEHIIYAINEGAYPALCEGRSIDQISIDYMIGYLEKNARSSKEHKKIAFETICILRGIYSNKTKVSKKLKTAAEKIESIRNNKRKKPSSHELNLERIRKCSKKCCDFTFVCQDGEERDHLSCMMQLPFFNTLSEGWEEKLVNEKSFNLKQFPRAAVQTVLDLFYNIPLPKDISIQNLIWTYSLANFFLLDEIKELIGNEIEKNPQNYVDGLILIYEEEKRITLESGEKNKEKENSQQIEPSPLEPSYSFLQKCYLDRLPWYPFVTEQKGEELIPYLESLAEQNDAFAQICLGDCLEKRIEGEKDLNQAVKLYAKAADEGFAPAQNKLGLCCLYGIGVDKNETTAVELFTKSIEQGYTPAQDNLGFCYLYGKGIDKNETKAAEIFTKLKEQGYPPAQNNLAICCIQGWGVDSNLARALALFQKACDQGFPHAKINLALLGRWFGEIKPNSSTPLSTFKTFYPNSTTYFGD